MSIDTIQDIHIEEKDGQWIATVPKIGVRVAGATADEALTNAQRAITAAMIAEAEERKRHTRGQDHTA
jgi:predicted RNase H-like HicB family nuclease